MKLLKQPDDSCLLYSTAMILDIEPQHLIRCIGHDGQQVWWPENKHTSYKKRSFHIQEIIEVCLSFGHGLCPIEIDPCSAPGNDPGNYKRICEDGEERFKRLINGKRGILIGKTKSGMGHACAWDGEKVYDPNGYIYPLDDFESHECWILI